MRRALLVFLTLILVLTAAALGGAVVAASPGNGNTHVVKDEAKTEYVWSNDGGAGWYRYKCTIRWHAVYTLLDPQTNLWHLTRQSRDGVYLEVVGGEIFPNPPAAALSLVGSTYQGFYTGTLTGTWNEAAQKLDNPGNWDMEGMWQAWGPDGLVFSNTRVHIHPSLADSSQPEYDLLFTNQVLHVEDDSFDGR
ncbi:MAG: hypothetical protein ACYC6I_06925 [Bacillota bacterium]